MYKVEKLDKTYTCNSLGELDIFIVRKTGSTYISVNDIIMDKVGKIDVDIIENYLSNIEDKFDHNSDLIIKDLDRFVYRCGYSKKDSAYNFLVRLWRDEKINGLL